MLSEAHSGRSDHYRCVCRRDQRVFAFDKTKVPAIAKTPVNTTGLSSKENTCMVAARPSKLRNINYLKASRSSSSTVESFVMAMHPSKTVRARCVCGVSSAGRDIASDELSSPPGHTL